MSDQLKHNLKTIMESVQVSETHVEKTLRGDRFEPHAARLCKQAAKELKTAGFRISEINYLKRTAGKRAWFNLSGDFNEIHNALEEIFDTYLETVGGALYSSLLNSKNNSKSIYLALQSKPLKVSIEISNETTDALDDDAEAVDESLKTLKDHLNEISPSDFGADDPVKAREEETLSVIEGGGTIHRAGARRMNEKRLKDLIRFGKEPEDDRNYLIILRNYLNWAEAIYSDLPEYESILQCMDRLVNYHRGKK